MEQRKEFGSLINEYDMTNVPTDGIEKMEVCIAQAKRDKQKARKKRLLRNWGVGVAAALAVLVILPMTNQKVAYAMENVPFIGQIFRIINIQNYHYENDGKEIIINLGELQAETEGTEQRTADLVNKSVEEYTAELVKKFKADIAESNEGYHGLDISYDVVTDTDRWFVLDIAAVETEASGYQTHKYYTIDKASGKLVTLADLFPDEPNYKEKINAQIISQMEKEPDLYWLKSDPENHIEAFTSIKEDQNFYINTDGKLVIVFDEAEVGPAYLGTPEFVISTK